MMRGHDVLRATLMLTAGGQPVLSGTVQQATLRWFCKGQCPVKLGVGAVWLLSLAAAKAMQHCWVVVLLLPEATKSYYLTA